MFGGRDFVSGLDAPLLQLSKKDPFTVRHLLAGGVQVFGSPGSGKTSGSGRTLAEAMLRAGMGGLVLCAKPDEAARWKAYCKATGRTMIAFDGTGARRFNFLDHTMAVQPGDGLTQNVVTLLLSVLDGAEGRFGNSQEDSFWRDSMTELLTNSINFLWCAYGRIQLAELMELVQTRPTKPEQVTQEEFQTTFFWGKTFRKAMDNPAQPMPERVIKAAFDYFVHVMAAPDQRTAGNVVATLSAKLSPFINGKLHDLFSTTTNVVPEMSWEGAVIVIDLPVATYAEAGVTAAHLWKYIWQKAALRRADADTTRPCFIWADECQFFLSPHDGHFVSTSRSSRSCTVYLTQNLPTYYARIKASNPADIADSLIGNFATKIFHAQSDARTNQYAADLIGKGVQYRASSGGSVNDGWNVGNSRGENVGTSSNSSQKDWSNSSSDGRNWNRNSGTSGGSGQNWSTQETIDYQIQPAYFTTLQKSGGTVQGVLFQDGRRFTHSGATWLPVSFKQ